MNEINIRKAMHDDLACLIELSKTTFVDTYADGNSPENLNAHLNKAFTEKQLKLELANNNSIFYLATKGKTLLGYLKLNFGVAQTALQDERALEIERIYVLKKHQGQRIGTRFCDMALTIAKMKKLNYIWLGVWEKNPRAIQFYKKNGFSIFDKHIFVVGKEAQTDWMMKRELAL